MMNYKSFLSRSVSLCVSWLVCFSVLLLLPFLRYVPLCVELEHDMSTVYIIWHFCHCDINFTASCHRSMPQVCILRSNSWEFSLTLFYLERNITTCRSYNFILIESASILLIITIIIIIIIITIIIIIVYLFLPTVQANWYPLYGLHHGIITSENMHLVRIIKH